MKRSTLLLGLLVLGLVAVALAAADFSGTWVIDKEKSEPMMGRGGQPGTVPDTTLVIKQSGNDLAVTRTAMMGGQERSNEMKYTLDGKESKNPGGRGGETISKARLEGDTIVIETETPRGTSKAVYALSDGGKVLTITTTMGERTRKEVFNKK